MYKFITLDEAVKKCAYIPNENKPIIIYQLHSSIELYKKNFKNEKLLDELLGISTKDYRDEGEALCDKLNDGIKAAKKLKKIVANIDRGNSVLINALNEFINNAEINLEIEKPKSRLIGGQVESEIHSLGLSFKSLWEFHTNVKTTNPKVIRIATLFFIEAGIYFKPNSALEHNEICNRVRRLFKKQLSGKSKITPYLQVVKLTNQKSRD